MLMWYIILIILILLTGLGLIYVSRRISRFSAVAILNTALKKYHLHAGFLIVSAVFIGIWIALNLMNAVICLLYVMLFWVISDTIFALIKRFSKKTPRHYYAGYMALLLSIATLTLGWYQNHHITATTYTLYSDKITQPFKIAFFADSHIGTTFNGTQFAEYIQKIQAEQPDILFIVGDFVDDNTTRSDMLTATQAFKNLHIPYGVYFVFGNHDKGYYPAKHRGFNTQDLLRALNNNGVKVLEDTSVILRDDMNLIGRQDNSENLRGNGRESMSDLTKDMDKNQFSIVLDHQPNDYQQQQEAAVDLVLSGHTHGGQLWPLNEVGVWIGANDKTYGVEKRDKTHFIVTSGLSDWSIRFKTGTHSEFVIIQLLPVKKF